MNIIIINFNYFYYLILKFLTNVFKEYLNLNHPHTWG